MNIAFLLSRIYSEAVPLYTPLDSKVIFHHFGNIKDFLRFDNKMTFLWNLC